MTMKMANIAEFKNNLSKYLAIIEQGEEVKICKRNIPIANVIPINTKRKKNHTKLGCGRDSVEIYTDLTEPMIPIDDWEMLKNEDSS